MKRILLALSSLFILSACDDVRFDGTLHAISNLLIQEEWKQCNEWDIGCTPGAQTFNLPAGDTNMKISFGQSGQDKEIYLEFKQNGALKKATINAGKDANLSDHFQFPASQIKQNFDVYGDVFTDVQNSSEYSDLESCIYYVRELVCYGGGHGPGYGHGGRHSIGNASAQPNDCRWEYVARTGRESVRYYYQTTTKDLVANFAQGGNQIATYTGRNTKNDKIYTYRGGCY